MLRPCGCGSHGGVAGAVAQRVGMDMDVKTSKISNIHIHFSVNIVLVFDFTMDTK